MTIIFGITSGQTRNSGIYKLKSISGELLGTINEAEKLTLNLAMAAQYLVNDKEKLEEFILESRESLQETDESLINIYIAGTGWDIIPDFTDRREDFVATRRNWYVGATGSKGTTFVTPPYIDAVTGNVCYTVSVMLADGDTVLGVDYTMSNIQAHISNLREEGIRKAVIVTSEGIIAGSTDESSIGKRLVEVHPEYEGIFSLAKNRQGTQTARIRSGILYENLFASQSGAGWYLIESEDDWELYRESYMQLLFILILTILFFGIIIALYVLSLRSQRRAEVALESGEKFIEKLSKKIRDPLGRIIDLSDNEYVRISDDHESAFARIHVAGENLLEILREITEYSNIGGKKDISGKKDVRKQHRSIGVNKLIRSWVVIFMLLVMIVSLYINMTATYQWGNIRMQNDVSEYESKLAEWINTQKSILDMFCSIISTDPEILDDYDKAIAYLDSITVQYPEISVSYMTNPEFEHTVYMNNGWEPEPGWKVEERQWYKDTIASENGYNISAPYYDEQTGFYCVTFSERVYDSRNGAFLGNFGIDFYMDKLIGILGDSYSDEGYAFLADAQGEIINHPFGRYQMAVDSTTRVGDLPYGEIRIDGKSTIVFRDYDGNSKILIAARDTASNFTIFVVSNFGRIYGRMIVYSIIILVTFISCMVLVYRLFTELILKEEKAKQSIQDAADAAIAAGNAKSRFLAQMSHEIRTPINAVLGMNEMILRESDSEDIKGYAENIRSSGNTLLSLINSILDFSKIEDGKMEIIPVRYDVAELINNLVNSVSERAKSKGLDLDVEIDESLPCELIGDDVRIMQIILNLLTNAVKYTENGCITFTVTEKSRTERDAKLEVVVRDTGIGIRKEDMARLFDSFQRLDEKKNRNIEGTGLGMAIVAKLLEMMGSSLTVDSVYGIGSRFSFVLNQQIGNPEPVGNYRERILKRPHENEEEQLVNLTGVSVLVVDDNEMNLKVAAGLFKFFGLFPQLARSGAETIEMVRNAHFDIIFLDHMMPVMDGIETLRRIREEDLIGDDTVVIALTANAVNGARKTYLEAAFDDYLSKPIEVKKLNEILKKYVKKGNVREENE